MTGPNPIVGVMSGVSQEPLRDIATPGGHVLHALKASMPGYRGFGEAYFSEIHQGTVKSWRRHNRVTMNLIVPVGAVEFIVHDDRAGSATQGAFCRHLIGRAAQNYCRLVVEPGLWMAFRGVAQGTSLILDIIDAEHDPGESDTRELDSIPYSW